MIVEVGHFALVLALCAALAQKLVPAWGAQLGDIRLMEAPLVTLIWLGGAAMAFGGALSLADRRLRFGVERRAKTIALAAPAQ